MHVAESLSLTACSQGILGRISRAQWLVLPIVLAALFGEPSAEADERSAPHRPEPARLRPLPKTAKLLFTSNQDAGTHRWEVYAMDARGRHVTRITRTDENHFLVGIDRSRRFIAATRGTEKRKRVWLLDLKTGTETPLTDPKNHAEGRSFSPDGKWIVFWMVKAGDQFSDIYKIRRDGTGLTNLTRTPRAHEFDPAWSNSGHAIAYSFNNGRPHRFVLRTMAPDGGRVRTVYTTDESVATAIFPAGVYDPGWSPDDKWLLVEKPVRFTGRGENGTAGVWRILKVSADGRHVVDLTGQGAHRNSAVYTPSFSPDGDTIVFTSRYGSADPARGLSINLLKMDSNGKGLRQLTNTPHWEQFAVWIR